MDSDQTPINARPKRRPPEALEDLGLSLREHLVWPVEDWALGLGDRGRALLAGGAVTAALAIGVGGFALASSGGGSGSPVTPPSPVAAVKPTPAPQAPPPQPQPKPQPTLHGAAPVFKPPPAESKVGSSKEVEAAAEQASAGNTGSAATDTISSTPHQPATQSARASTSAATVDGPPAGPAAIAVAREFAQTFVVYETGGDKAEIRKGFAATTTPELRRALLRRPPHQPAGVKVPKAKVLNVVPAPSHGTVFPVSVSLLRVGVTSELRLEMEKLKKDEWRVINVLG
jgi:hypothetical protein